MVVAELIDLLSAYPADMLVLVEGYEAGYDGIRRVVQKNMDIHHHTQDWDGEFKESVNGGSPCLLILGRLECLR